MSTLPCRVDAGAERGEEVWVARNAATRTLHRLDEHGSDLIAVLGHCSLERCSVVVGKDQPVVRDVDGVRARAERDDAAVVPVLEHHDL